MLKRFVAGFVCLCVVVVFSTVSTTKNGTLSVLGYSFNVNNLNIDNGQTVIIDAGHGGLTNTTH